MEAPRTAPELAENQARARVLVVDDDQGVRSMLAAWLHSEGLQYEVVADARGAREALAARDFDLLLCDIHLPDADGPDLVTAMAERNRGVPVIFLTGNPTLDTAIRSVQLRVVAYLVKPPNIDELGRLVRKAVAAHRERRAISASRRRLRDWDQQLSRIESALEASGESPPGVEHLRVTLHQLAGLLVDLDRSIEALISRQEGREAQAWMETVGSLRRTVEVLERTRMNFKSKALGDLRKEIEGVLARLGRP